MTNLHSATDLVVDLDEKALKRIEAGNLAVVLGYVIVSIFMQMRQTKMWVHSFYILKKVAPLECDTAPSKNIAQAFPNHSIHYLWKKHALGESRPHIVA